MAKRVAIVTGANRGLGLETARELAQRGSRVLITARREEEGARAAASISTRGPDAFAWPLDVGDAGSISAFAARARDEALSIDALVNNAGVYRERLDPAAARESIDVNTLGPLRLTDALAPLLARGARVVMVSSGMGQLAELPAPLRRLAKEIADRAGVARLADALVRLASAGGSARSYALAYAVSKAALNAETRLLAAELAPRGVLVNAVCPGWVRTEMGGAGAPRSVEEGAAGIVWAATLPPDGPSGGFYRDGEPIPW